MSTPGSAINRLRLLGAISALEGVFYLANALFVVIGISREGLTGPAEVSNAPGVTLEVIIFGTFGVGMVVVAVGWFRSRRWARAPFVLAQILALVISIPLLGATDALQQTAAVAVTVVTAAGLFLAFTPRVTQHLLEPGAHA